MAYLGHAWTKGCDCGCEEREGYEYQQDDCNCDFYSLLTDEEFSQLENEVENTGKFKASYLYHLGNSDSDKVEHWLELEVVDDIGDIYKAARLLATDFGQTTLAKVVCKLLWKRNGMLKLKAGNPTFPDITPKEGQILEVWGVVLTSIKRFSI